MKTADMKLLRKLIKQIVGDWRRETFKTYMALAERLIAQGFNEEEAADILGEAYGAATSDYGD